MAWSRFLVANLISPGCRLTTPPGRTIGSATPVIVRLSAAVGPRTDDTEAINHWPEFDRLRHYLVIGAHGHHDLAGLIGDDNQIRHQKRISLAAIKLHASEGARCQEVILVVEDRTPANGAGPGIELVIDKIHLALMFPLGLIRQTHPHRVRRITTRGARSRSASGANGIESASDASKMKEIGSMR